MKQGLSTFHKTRVLLAMAALFFSCFLAVSCKGGGGYGGGGRTTPPEAFSLISPSTTMGH